MDFPATDIAAMLGAFSDQVYIGAQIYFDGLQNFDAVTTIDNIGTSGGTRYACLFEQAGKQANMFTGQVETTSPWILMSSADVADSGVSYGSPLVVNGRLFYALSVDPDGAGFSTVTLSVEVLT